MALLIVAQTIFNRLPERLGKNRQTQSKVQRKRQTPMANEDNTHKFHGSETEDTPHITSPSLQKVDGSAGFQASTLGSGMVDLNEFASQEAPFNPSLPLAIPDWPVHDDFTRFLGPDSIEDLFRPEPEQQGSVVTSNMDYTAILPFQNFSSLDQYVSTLDLHEGQEYLHDINEIANDVMLPTYTGLDDFTTDNGGVQPFIPLSPYLMKRYGPDGNAVFRTECVHPERLL